MRLTVHEGQASDNYKDIVRVHKANRNGVDSGFIAKVSVTDGKSIYVVVRGLGKGQEREVWMDLQTRKRLGVELGKEYDFNVRAATWWEKVIWAAKASDPSMRIGTCIGLVGILLGILLSAVQIWQGLK